VALPGLTLHGRHCDILDGDTVRAAKKVAKSVHGVYAMSRPSKETGVAPAQRDSVPRKRVRKDFRFSEQCVEMLVSLKRMRRDGRPESDTAVVERLILQASRQPQLF
jgi:hypothetical protein